MNLGTGKVDTRTNSYKMGGTGNTPEMSYDWNDWNDKLINSDSGSSTILARLFVTDKNTKVTLQPTNSSATFTAKVIHDANVIDKQELPSLKNSNVTNLNSVNNGSVKANFNGDGVEDVIATGWSESFADTKPFDAEYGFHFALIKAKDTMDISQGIQIAKIYEPFPNVKTYLAPLSLVI